MRRKEAKKKRGEQGQLKPHLKKQKRMERRAPPGGVAECGGIGVGRTATGQAHTKPYWYACQRERQWMRRKGELRRRRRREERRYRGGIPCVSVTRV